MKHLFIVNPIAGGKNHSDFVAREAEKAFTSSGEDFELYVTLAPMDAAVRVAAEAKKGDPLRVYACGGDGTLNECLNGAVGYPNVALTHFPCGTGNDFLKTFGPNKALFSDLNQLLRGEVRPIDVIDCNGRYCINICSVGIDARIGTDVHKYSRIPLLGGPTGYVVSTAVNFFKGINRPFRIQAGARTFEGQTALVCICNGRYYGGGFNPVPDARPDDGLLEFLVVKGVSRLTFARVVYHYAKGRYRDYPQLISHFRGREMSISAEGDFVVNLDGEAMTCRTLDVRLIPGGVNFLFPRNLDYFMNSDKKKEV
jgi:YegS/Rv2252/BmrU family lipid kinase